jgi:hypothetical protein
LIGVGASQLRSHNRSLSGVEAVCGERDGRYRIALGVLGSPLRVLLPQAGSSLPAAVRNALQTVPDEAMRRNKAFEFDSGTMACAAP